MSRAAKKQSGENSLTSAEELKDIKENLSSLSLDVAEVLKIRNKCNNYLVQYRIFKMN